MDQSARTAALDQFRKGEVRCWSPPTSPRAASTFPTSATSSISTCRIIADDYVHRIGRTGRAGRSGTAITIVAPADRKGVAAIEKLIGQTIPWMGASRAARRLNAPRPTERHEGEPNRGHGTGTANRVASRKTSQQRQR